MNVNAVHIRHGHVSDAPAVSSGAALTDAALAVSELRYRRLFEAAQDGILILDAQTGMVVDVNPFLIALLGYWQGHGLGVGHSVWQRQPEQRVHSGPQRPWQGNDVQDLSAAG